MNEGSPRSPRRAVWSCALLALALAAAFLFQQLLLGRPLVRDDASLFVYPLFHALAKAFRAGHLYLWDPQQWCGLPALATGQSGGLYPLHFVLLRVLPWMTGLHVAYWLHLALALLGMVWVARNLGIGWKAALVGGVLYAFSGYSAAHLVHYNFIAAAAHLPLTLAVLQTALKRNEWRWWGLLGLEVALAFVVSHPQIFLMIVAVAGLWLVAGEWWSTPFSGRGYQPRQSRLPGLLVAALLATLLLMPQLLPTLELARESRGVYAGQAMDAKSFISSYPFRWIDLPRVVLPDLFGTAEANVIGGGPAFHETCAFVGVGALLLGLVGLIAGWGRRGWWFAVLVLLVGASLVPAGNPIYLLVAKVPFLSNFRAMGRWALVAIAGLSLLVSLGLDALPTATERRRALCAKLAGLLGVLLIFGLVALWATFGAEGGALTLPGQPGKAIEVKNMASAMYNSLVGWEPLLFIWSAALALGAIYLGAKGNRGRRYWLLSALAITVPLWCFWQTTNRPGPRDYYTALPRTAEVAGDITGRCTTLPPELVMKDNSWRQQAGRQDLSKALLTPALGTVWDMSYAEGYKQGLVTPSTLRFWNDYYRYGVQAFTGQTNTTGETLERVGTPLERMRRFHKIVCATAIVTTGMLDAPGLKPNPVDTKPVSIYTGAGRQLAWLVEQAQTEPDPEQQLQRVKERAFDPDQMAVVDQPVPGLQGGTDASRPLRSVSVAEREGGLLEAQINASEAPRPALLVISQAWYPGWRAYVDGQPAPLLRADYAIKAVPVPAGDHVVQLRFQSESWRRGLWLGLVGLVLLTTLLVRGGAAWTTASSSAIRPGGGQGAG